MLYDYLPPEALAALARHPDTVVRHAIEDVRQMAQELLLARMRELGFRYRQEWDDPQTPYLLWQAVQEGPESVTEAECMELERLHKVCNGWWLYGRTATPEFLDAAAWAEEYRHR